MEPIKFKEQTGILKRPYSMTDDECGPLPIHHNGESYISCWKMGLRERIKALLFGRVWLYVFSKISQPPVAMVCDKTVFDPIKKKKTTGYQHFWNTVCGTSRKKK